MSTKTARSYLIYQLQARLYADFYIRASGSTSNWGETSSTDATAFLRALSIANSGTGCCENGWSVAQLNANEVVVSKGGLQLRIFHRECASVLNGPKTAGSQVGLRLPKELLNASPGYYMALGNCGDIAPEGLPLVRLYWNLRANGAGRFVEGFSRLLNHAGIYFRLKVLNDPVMYTRCDAGVLYFRKADRERVSEVVSTLYSSVAPFLNPEVPAFTRRIAPGIGLAEDPGTQESFGQHRCRILAEGIICAHEKRAKSLHERLRIVESHFATAGIRLSEPHLNPHSEDNYNFAVLR